MKKQMTLRSALFLLILALAGVLALSACGGKNNDGGSSAIPSASDSSPAPATPSSGASASSPSSSGATKEITVTGSNFKFEPAEIQVHKGDTVKLTLKNKEGPHGLEIPDFNVNIKDGETTTFVVDKTGTFDFKCSVQCGSGHESMTGQLIVE